MCFNPVNPVNLTPSLHPKALAKLYRGKVITGCQESGSCDVSLDVLWSFKRIDSTSMKVFIKFIKQVSQTRCCCTHIEVKSCKWIYLTILCVCMLVREYVLMVSMAIWPVVQTILDAMQTIRVLPEETNVIGPSRPENEFNLTLLLVFIIF